MWCGKLRQPQTLLLPPPKLCRTPRLDTDILFGQNNGLLSCLTLSGVTTEAKLLSEENKVKPDFYVGSIAEFM